MKEIPVYCSYTKMMPVSELKKRQHPRNPNSHPSEQIDVLCEIIKNNGWRQPIKISKRSGLITCGHGRLLSAIRMGLKSAPVDEQEYEDEKAEMADVAADNMIQKKSVLDIDACLDIMSDFSVSSVECQSFGFSIDDFEAYSSLPNLEDMSGKFPKKEKKIEQSQPADTEKVKNKPRFKCPKCGHEEL
jgi:DNA-directed RNA polymerase subunit M/transcription elongation factor TFIIS